MIVPIMEISYLVLTQQIYSEETNGAHAHNRDRVPLKSLILSHPMVRPKNLYCDDTELI